MAARGRRRRKAFRRPGPGSALFWLAFSMSEAGSAEQVTEQAARQEAGAETGAEAGTTQEAAAPTADGEAAATQEATEEPAAEEPKAEAEAPAPAAEAQPQLQESQLPYSEEVKGFLTSLETAPVIDWNLALQQVDNDRNFLFELLQDLYREGLEHLKKCLDAVQEWKVRAGRVGCQTCVPSLHATLTCVCPARARPAARLEKSKSTPTL